MKACIDEGFNLLSLDGLHAKVLLLDDCFAFVGSQNFTTGGRRNKEATVLPIVPMDGSRFVSRLISWREEAEQVEAGILEQLLKGLEGSIRRHRALLASSQKAFADIVSAYEEAKQKAELERIQALERKSRIRLAQGAALATVRRVGGEWDPYLTLKPDQGHDLTQWVDDSKGDFTLSRLNMYPVLLTDSHRMCFARIGRFRITYFRKSLNWIGKPLEVSDMHFQVRIDLPSSSTKRRNIISKLSHSYRGSVEFALSFSGDDVNVVRTRFIKGSPAWADEYPKFVQTLKSRFFGSKRAIRGFLDEFLTDFQYETLGRDDKNLREYLDGTRYRVSVVQYGENPFVVLTKLW